MKALGELFFDNYGLVVALLITTGCSGLPSVVPWIVPAAAIAEIRSKPLVILPQIE
jgi:hypothetical protein